MQNPEEPESASSTKAVSVSLTLVSVSSEKTFIGAIVRAIIINSPRQIDLLEIFLCLLKVISATAESARRSSSVSNSTLTISLIVMTPP